MVESLESYVSPKTFFFIDNKIKFIVKCIDTLNYINYYIYSLIWFYLNFI